jgi:hypothetical protein
MRKLYLFTMAMLVSSAIWAANVTFTVNMSNVTVSANGVHVAGNFDANGSSGTAWDPSAYTMMDMGGGYYAATIDLEPGMYEFKFINDNDWSGVESVPAGAQVGGGNGNRWVYADGATVVDTVAFGGMADIGKHGVLLQVNMATQTISPLGVHVAGSFQDPAWDPSATMMHNPDGSNMYKHLFQVMPGTSIEFKYVNGDVWGDDETVPPGCAKSAQNKNRFFDNITGDSIYPEVCYGSCDQCEGSLVTFQVDMSNETVSPDGVHIAGAFQGWNPSATPMTDIGNGLYEVQLTIQNQSHQFKFVNGNSWGNEESIPSGCLVSGNREINVSADTLYKVCFASCTWPCVQFPDSSTITFGVEIPDTITVPADPDSGGVWIEGSFTNPSWQDGAVKMMDDDGDGIYTYTIKLGGAPEIQYKYVLGKPNTAGFEEESADFETDGCGVSNPVSTPNRLFNRTDMDEGVGHIWNSCDTVFISTSIGSIGAVGNSVKLFPNPTEGVTYLEFEKTANYDIRVYDLSGKMVERISARNNLITLNTEDYTQGMYIVDIRDENNDQLQLKLVVQ